MTCRLKENVSLEDPDIDRSVILKFILKKIGGEKMELDYSGSG
jgi:hypothetical protein